MFRTLTASQKQVVITKKRKVVVKACPGSGKTFCVAARLAYRLKSWDKNHNGIATLSFTNVAWQEIRDTLQEHYVNDCSLRFPHFLGTIDSFINQFIFLPFGHKVIKCSSRPTMVGEPYGRWTSGWSFYDKCFCDLVYDIEGNIHRKYAQLVKNEQWEKNKDEFEKAKKRWLKTGLATQEDANFFSLQILRKYPSIARALAIRFPIIVIDEAQDTTDIQMSIFDCLIKAGLKEIMLVGDPDQAIFEWNEANPKLFIQKWNRWRANSLELTQNRRSSENICSFASRLSSFPNPFHSINFTDAINKCHLKPEIIGYSDPTHALTHFRESCERSGLMLDSKTVLCRSRNLVSDLLSGDSRTPAGSKPESKWEEGLNGDIASCLAQGKFAYENGIFINGMHRCEKAIVMLRKKQSTVTTMDIRDVKEKIGVSRWRKGVYKFVSRLPEMSLSTQEWFNEADALVKKINSDVDLKTSFKPKYKDMMIKDIFLKYEPGSSVNGIEITTIHGAKGRTIDAVLVILKSKASNGKLYKTLLKEISNQDCTCLKPEELRTVYVGITRPRKILVLAVPEADLEIWKRFFEIDESAECSCQTV